MTTRQPSLYPPLPEMDARTDQETAESYGLRAFRFVLETGITATVDDEALRLATHVYRVAVANADLLPASIDRLAQADREINAAIRRRQRQDSPETAPGGPRNDDRPNAGPMAPLTPRPLTQPPAPAHAIPTTTGPAAIPARYTAISPAIGARPGAQAPALQREDFAF